MYVNGGSVLAVGIIFPILGVLAVGGRFLARRKRQAPLLLDDWLCIPALVFMIFTGGVLIYGSVHKVLGYNMYSNELPPLLLGKLQFICDTTNPVGTGLIRLSFLFFYRRLFRGKSFVVTNWIVIGLVIAWILAFTILQFAQCGSRLSAMWTGYDNMRAYCINTLKVIGLMGITAFPLDVIIMTLPFFWIWRLHTSSSQKWAVTCVFLCGAFTIGASALRMIVGVAAVTWKPGMEMNILGLEIEGGKGIIHVPGATSIWLFWQYIEFGTGLVVCCLPTLKGLYKAKPSPDGLRRSSSWNSVKAFAWISKSRRSSANKETDEPDEKESRHITVTQTVDLDEVSMHV